LEGGQILFNYPCIQSALNNTQANITRSKEEAIAILKGYESEIGGSADKFGALASKHSDCSSHAQNGDLGWFGPGQMQKAFEDGTYALEVGQISDVIESDSGVHLIMRTG
jgi:NIMA-interacting peptidyl-prolyl cis-trans isomerase 1